MRGRLLASCCCVVAFVAQALGGEADWPEITAQNKPWSRWWWLGNVGAKEDYSRAMEQYARAGLGGLEITPIYGARGDEQQFRNYLSSEWMSLLDHVLDEGARLGLGIDMSTGTGWPFGGPWVTPETASRHVVTKTYSVKASERLSTAVTATEEPIVRVAGPRRVAIGELRDPVTANANLQDMALDQVRFPRQLPLQALVAYSSSGDKIDLTAKVAADGKLDWVAPGHGVGAKAASDGRNEAGASWTLYAVFMGWHGKQVERAGPGGEGDAIDHFSSAALSRYLQHFDAAYAGHQPNRLRAYFNDSYEVDDAQGESNWTPRFFEEFRRRRGYDLRDELPAFFGRDTEDKNARVLADHRETISDLLLEEFTMPWAAWAKRHNGIIRNQAHGSPANIIDLYAASDIPETEGANIVGMKLASSAAHVTGKLLTSAETATWLDEHWVSSLGDIKRRVDLMFLGGVNHNCYHGTVFSPANEPWPGHRFYASVELDPANSIWADFDVLNRYVARTQAFLQQGRPANDILLYYPMHDVWGRRGNGAMPHVSQGGVRGSNDAGLGPQLLARGYTFDFVTDRLLTNVEYRDGMLVSGGNRYRVVLVPETKFMPLDTLYHLYRLAESGATIVFHRALPQDVPGWGKLLARRSEFQVHTEAFRRAVRGEDGVTTLAWNRGRLLLGADWEKLVQLSGVARETLVDRGLQFERRTHEQGKIYFLINRDEKPFDGWVPLATVAAEVVLFDPMTGQSGRTAVRRGDDGALEMRVTLNPGETCIAKTFAGPVREAPAFARWTAAGKAEPWTAPWKITFVSGGPKLPPAVSRRELGSWTDFGGDEVKAFSGTASYTTTIRGAGSDLLLDLGQVADSARVKVNGREVAALLAAPWRAVIEKSALRDGDNELEVLVTNLAANRVAELDRRDPSWKKFYNINYPARIGANRGADGNFSAAKWPPRAAGLLGPVTLMPVSRGVTDAPSASAAR